MTRVAPGVVIRRGVEHDLAAVSVIQQSSPEASQWPVTEYLQYDLRVAEISGELAGFLVARTVAEGEHEVLNLAVAPEYRRRGIARGLLLDLSKETFGDIYLEVRESNAGARIFYKSMGFQEIGSRPSYYKTVTGGVESAIVMKFHSC